MRTGYLLPLIWSNSKLKETSKPKLDPAKNYLHEIWLASRPDSPGPLLNFPDLESRLSKHSQGYCYHILLVESTLERTYHSASPVDTWKRLWYSKQDQEMSFPLTKRYMLFCIALCSWWPNVYTSSESNNRGSKRNASCNPYLSNPWVPDCPVNRHFVAGKRKELHCLSCQGDNGSSNFWVCLRKV